MQDNDLRLGRGARLIFEDADGGDMALTFNTALKRLELSRTPSGELLWSNPARAAHNAA